MVALKLRAIESNLAARGRDYKGKRTRGSQKTAARLELKSEFSLGRSRGSRVLWRQLAVNRFDPAGCQLGRMPVVIFERRPEFLLDLPQRLAFLEPRIDLVPEPFQKLAKPGKLRFAAWISVTRYVHVNVPGFELAKVFNPPTDISGLRTHSEPRVIGVLETIPEKQHFSCGQVHGDIACWTKARDGNCLRF